MNTPAPPPPAPVVPRNLFVSLPAKERRALPVHRDTREARSERAQAVASDRRDMVARVAARTQAVAVSAAAARGPAPPPIAGWHEPGAAGPLTLMPGELWFGAAATTLKTLLGSCVAVTLWHPRLRLGGMCHYLLPERNRKAGQATDGRYGAEAVPAMAAALERAGASSREFVAHLYGGADTLGEVAGVKLDIGVRNIERGWELLDRYGFQLAGVDVGDTVSRMVTLDLRSGTVECRRGKAQ